MGNKLVKENTVVIQYNNEMWDLKKKLLLNVFVDEFKENTHYFRITMRNFKTLKIVATCFLYAKGDAYKFAWDLFTKDYINDVFKLCEYIRTQCEEVFFLGKE